MPRLDQYFGPWLIEPTRGMAMWQHARTMNLAQHVANYSAAPKSYLSFFGEAGPMSRDQVASTDGKVIAIVDIAGTMMKSVPSMEDGVSTIRIRQEIRSAALNNKIGGLINRFDSPGGTVSGTSDLAGDIQFAVTQKPTWGFGEDMVASAALWCFTQCGLCFANAATAHIGSIGTVLGLYDYSANAAMEGIKALVFSTGPLKGAGFPGSEITDEQRAYFQAIVDEIQPTFSQAVAMGRKLTLTHVNALATGGIFSAPKAKELGLIDGIQSFDETLNQMFAQIERAKPASNSKRGSKMKDANSNPNAEDATPDQMRASITADLSKFVGRFGAENGAKWFTESKTFEQALDQHCQTLEAKIAADREAMDKLIKEADAKVADLEARLKEVKLGEKSAVSFQDGEKKKPAGKQASNLGSGLSALASEIEDKMPGAKASA